MEDTCRWVPQRLVSIFIEKPLNQREEGKPKLKIRQDREVSNRLTLIEEWQMRDKGKTSRKRVVRASLSKDKANIRTSIYMK